MRTLMITLLSVGLFSLPLFSQGHGHGACNGHGMWPDSLQYKTYTGIVSIDSSAMMPMYYLDQDNDGEADVHLAFGPYWYEPASGAERPKAGDEITIVGADWGHEDEYPTVVVFEINGLVWRKSVEGNDLGWDGDHFWGDAHEEITVTGTIIVDSTYYYMHFFLDEDGDGNPEFILNFGPPWHLERNEAALPEDGATVTIVGGSHEEPMMMIPSLMVFQIDGVQWRNHEGPPPWSGNWIHRDAHDTTFVHAPTDSMDWMSHPPGSMMGMMMGGGQFPDSVYCQFEEVYPDYLPGGHEENLFAGYYMNMYQPNGQMMMGMDNGNGSNMGGDMRSMRFNKPTTFNFHYEDDELHQMDLSENNIQLKFWHDEMSHWMEISGYEVDTESNTITFQSDEMNTYYAIFGSTTITSIEKSDQPYMTPDDFKLMQNYPNPFNPETTIPFQINTSGNVRITVFDILGQETRTLLNEHRQASFHNVVWNGRNNASQLVPSGIYFVKLESGGQIQSMKIALTK